MKKNYMLFGILIGVTSVASASTVLSCKGVPANDGAPSSFKLTRARGNKFSAVVSVQGQRAKPKLTCNLVVFNRAPGPGETYPEFNCSDRAVSSSNWQATVEHRVPQPNERTRLATWVVLNRGMHRYKLNDCK